MASVGTLTANLIAQTSGFTKPLQHAQKQIEQFNARIDKVQKQLDKVSKTGVKAGLAFSALTGAITVGVKNVGQYAQELQIMANRTGMTISEVQEMQYVAKQTGVEFNSLQKLTQSLSQKVLEAQSASSAMARAFDYLGVNTRDSSGQLRSINDVFSDMLLALSRVNNATERNALAMKIFGEESKNIIPLLTAGEAEINRMRQEARDLGVVMSDTAVSDFTDFNRQLKSTADSVTSAGRQLVAQFLPAISVVLEWVNKGVNWFKNLSQEQMSNIKRWVALTATILGVVAVFGIMAKVFSVALGVFKTVSNVLTGVKAAISMVGDVIGERSASTILWFGLIAGALALFYMAWKNNWFGIRDIITNVWEKYIKPVLDAIVKWGAKTIKTVWNWSIKALGKFWEWLKDVAWPWLSKTAKTAWDWTIEALGPFFEWLKDVALPLIGKAFATAWNWSIDVLGKFWEWLRDVAFPWLGKVLSTIWTWEFKALGVLFNWLIDTALPFIGKMIVTEWQWIIEGLGKLWDLLIDKAIPWIGGSLKTTWEWTFKALGKLWDWLEKGANWVGDTVKTTIEFSQKGLGKIQQGLKNIQAKFAFQQGGILPGIGGPDQIPALLAPGEAVIPGTVWRKGLLAVAAWFKKMGVPGYKAGGIVDGNNGGGILGMVFPDLSAAISEQGGLIKSLGNVINNIPQMLINGLFSLFDGLISVIGKLASAILGEEEAERIAGTFRSWQNELKRFFGTLGFFEDESVDAAETVTEAAEDVASVMQTVTKRSVLLSEALNQTWATVREKLPILSKAMEVYQNAIVPVIDELGMVTREAMTSLEALGLVAINLITQSESFARLFEIANPLIESFTDALGQVLTPLLPIAQVVSDTLLPTLSVFGSVIGSLIAPAMQVLFKVLKTFGTVILALVQGISSVWNILLDLVSLLPFVNLRSYKIDLDDLSSATAQLARLTWEEARTRAENIEVIEESTRAMANVPSVFKIALRRGQVADIPATAITPLQAGGIVTRPTLALIGEKSPEAVVPLNTMQGRRGSEVVIEVNINCSIFGFNDFRRVIEQAMSEAARSAGLAQYGVVVKFT